MRALSDHQQEVMDVLRQRGAYLHYWADLYELKYPDGSFRNILGRTFHSLRGRGLIKSVPHPHRHDPAKWIEGMSERVWVAAAKGDGDAGEV